MIFLGTKKIMIEINNKTLVERSEEPNLKNFAISRSLILMLEFAKI